MVALLQLCCRVAVSVLCIFPSGVMGCSVDYACSISWPCSSVFGVSI